MGSLLTFYTCLDWISAEQTCEMCGAYFDGLEALTVDQLKASVVPNQTETLNPRLRLINLACCCRFQELSVSLYFLMGALAKTAATFVTYPIQLVQSRLRVFLLIFPSRVFLPSLVRITVNPRINVGSQLNAGYDGMYGNLLI